VVSGPLTVEVQVAAVSGFLSFVPFQILKRTRQDSREIILRGQRGSAVTHYPVAAFCFARSRFFEVARVFVRLNHVACFIVNANHCIIPNPGLPIGVPKFQAELAAAFLQIGR